MAKEIQFGISWDALVSLMKGHTVMLLGKDGEPDMRLIIEDNPANNAEEAMQEIWAIWENTQ